MILSIFTRMWRIPFAYALKVGASCFENCILLSRRFNAAHLFNNEEETGGD